ncbi:MAG: ubiquinol-cytochrome c reductase iron-sulfur subunit [Candidatus Bipolaricaulia bacterium]
MERDHSVSDGTDHERRSFIQRLLQTVCGIGGLGVLGGIGAFLFPPERQAFRPGPARLHVGPADAFDVGEGRQVQFEGTPVWVLRLPSGFAAFSAICTHKGCIIDWDETRRLLRCPCHGGLFDTHGNVASGLPRHPLPRIDVGVVRGEVVLTAEEDEDAV